MVATESAAAVTVACLQFGPIFGECKANIDLAIGMLEEAHQAKATLAVLPELFDTGYVFQSRQEACALATEVGDSVTLSRLAAAAAAMHMHIVAGFAERAGDRLFNSAAVIGPGGLLGVYRKNHLWAEEALYFEPGDRGFPVFTTPLGRIAPLICYDGWFAESWRRCGLGGADIACVPTNWVPMPGQRDDLPAMANILCMAGAHSNGIFVAAACRIGTERGQPFIGQSLIVGPHGWPIAGPAPVDEPAILLAECDLADARRARTLNSFNHLLRDRRSDVYGELDAAPSKSN
jgi:N-carbamoylputrescine amidase